MQENIEISDDLKVTGTLKYVDDYTGFSGDPAEQVGNYIALDFSSQEADWIEVNLVGGLHPGWKKLDADGILITRITDQKTQYILVRGGYESGGFTSTLKIDLSGLELETE